MTNRPATNIGHVKETESGNFEGKLSLLNFVGNIVILPVTDAKEGDNAPDYTINRVSEDGELFRIGSARDKVAKSSGNPYIALAITYFEITNKPIYANLVQDRQDPEKLNILV